MTRRFTHLSQTKSSGATYTPEELADFVAQQMLSVWKPPREKRPIRILDPAVGDGQLLDSLLRLLPGGITATVTGYDQDANAVLAARERLSSWTQHSSQNTNPHQLQIVEADFLASFAEDPSCADAFDLVIANPPYVRTQIIGASVAQALSENFQLTGRVDLYHAFVLAIHSCLAGDGALGLIVSNRFMTTKSGQVVRRAMRENLRLRHVWDFGDTKLFDAAVLPAVIVAEGRDAKPEESCRFSSIYEATEVADATPIAVSQASSAIGALTQSGLVTIPDGRKFSVMHGGLKSDDDPATLWRLATDESEAWLATVEKHTHARFGDIGSVRVGVKTCADKVFIRDDWDAFSEATHGTEAPELLRPLTTHHVARRFRADASQSRRQILYPHQVLKGKRVAVDIEPFPNTKAYLEKHSETLRGRTYVSKAGRQWYEIWVPHDPDAWKKTKLVFRDIAAQPCFWIDQSGSVVNGDCYWIACGDEVGEEKTDLLWLAAAIGNSTFIERFYDHRFNNKLYAGRRRFLTQYVEQFPLPDPATALTKRLIAGAQQIYREPDHASTAKRIQKLDALVWEAFGVLSS